MTRFLKFRRIPRPLLYAYSRNAQQSRGLSIAAPLHNSSKPFSGGPAPPRLSKEEQEIFEQLQRQSTGAFSAPRSPPKVNQSPDSEAQPKSAPEQAADPRFNASGEGEELHPDLRVGAKPEFEGDKNPRTGEVGGPKTEPLRWGGAGDWSYNGRVTDF